MNYEIALKVRKNNTKIYGFKIPWARLHLKGKLKLIKCVLMSTLEIRQRSKWGLPRQYLSKQNSDFSHRIVLNKICSQPEKEQSHLSFSLTSSWSLVCNTSPSGEITAWFLSVSLILLSVNFWLMLSKGAFLQIELGNNDRDKWVDES